MLLATLVSTLLLCFIHLFVGRAQFLDRGQGSWKSAAGGVGVTYTFLVLLPKVAKSQPVLERATESSVYGFLAHHSYLVALAGLVLYYGMDAAVETLLVWPDRRSHRPLVRFLVYTHASLLSGYYLLVSYLMAEDREMGYVGYISLTIFTLAMLLHYATIDHGLRMKYGGIYKPFLRWTFVAASLGGWLLASTTRIPYTSLALLNCLFAGALLFFTLKEKVPESGSVRFWPFCAGVVGFTMLVLVIEVLE